MSFPSDSKSQMWRNPKNRVLHPNVSVDAVDERGRSGATGRRTKASLVEQVIQRQRQREQPHAGGPINRPSVCHDTQG